MCGKYFVVDMACGVFYTIDTHICTEYEILRPNRPPRKRWWLETNVNAVEAKHFVHLFYQYNETMEHQFWRAMFCEILTVRSDVEELYVLGET